MKELSGAAKDATTWKNIGKELKEDGKMNDGIGAVLLKVKADTITQTIDFLENQNKSLPVVNNENSD